MSIAISMIGGRGYVGEELLRLIDDHPFFSVHRVISRSLAGRRVGEVYPEICDGIVFEDASPAELAQDGGDAWILALGNGEAAAWVDQLPSGCGAIDLSADYRFDDTWTYGLPERFGTELIGARRVSNPGCYATAAQLTMLPLIDQIQGSPTVMGLSGYSGAGRRPSPRNDQKRLADNLLPYALVGHIHEKEISRQLGINVHFTPHVMSFFRGLSVTVDMSLSQPETSGAIMEQFENYYAGSPATQVVESIPEITEVRDTAQARVGGFGVDGQRLVMVSVIDNLKKGAATQALQNLNLMYNRPIMEGLA